MRRSKPSPPIGNEAINAFNISAESGEPYRMTTSFEIPEVMVFE